jgi:hypothetical protein
MCGHIAMRIAHNSRLLSQYESWKKGTAKILKNAAKNTPPEWLSQIEHRLFLIGAKFIQLKTE